LIAFAGQKTEANVLVSLLANVDVSTAMAWMVGGGGAFYGYRERKLRKKTISHMASRVEKAEQLIDPNRTSSGLTKSGDTNTED